MNAIKTLLDIDQVNHLTGLPQSTLRNWEKRYGFPTPQRTKGGHRLYSVEDVEKIRKINQLHLEGMKLSEAIECTLSQNHFEQSGLAADNKSETLNQAISRILKSLYSYDVVTAEDYLSKLGMRLNEIDLLEMIYPSLLTQIGEDWETSKINIAQEHFAWNFLRSHILQFTRTRNSSLGLTQPKALLATLEGELHEGGLILLAAFLQLKGWKVYYLGVNLPMKDLAHASKTIDPDVICLSAILPNSIQQHLPELAALHETVIIGGQCANEIKPSALPSDSFFLLNEGSLSSCINKIDLIYRSRNTKR